MADAGVLFDVTKCIGCGSCTVACKMWNELSFDKGNAHGYDVHLDDQTWTVVDYRDTVTAEGDQVLRFIKRQCMHCVDPACVSVCFAKAIQVDGNGAVVYNEKKCVGCRYCLIGCPYDIPKYEWDKVFPSIMKCQLCAGKLGNNEAPACAAACPSGALTFGSRKNLLAAAKKTIAEDSKYIPYVYGEKEGGGTRWLYISDVPFEALGLPGNLPKETIPSIVHDYTKWKPSVFTAAAAVFGALGFYTHRRLKVEEAKKAAKEETTDV